MWTWYCKALRNPLRYKCEIGMMMGMAAVADPLIMSFASKGTISGTKKVILVTFIMFRLSF